MTKIGVAVFAVFLLGMGQSVTEIAADEIKGSSNMFVGGRINFVQLYAEGFTIQFKDFSNGTNPADDCLNTRVYVLELTHGQKLLDRAYEMALMAVVNDKHMSIVIDKNINGPGGLCEATSGNMLVRPF